LAIHVTLSSRVSDIRRHLIQLEMLIFTKITVDEELVFVVIENVVFVFVDDVHRAKDVQGIVNSSLNILKIDSLPFLHIKMISF
jgi:hypothetical protein